MQMTDLSHSIWLSKYCLKKPDGTAESAIGDTFRRVAAAAAEPETSAEHWRKRFEDILADYRFLPGGRILAGAGSGRGVTLFNCFVAARLEDSLEGILRGLDETARTMQQGGGIGIDFSTLRPAGSPAQRTGGTASGPVSFLGLWDALCATLLSTSARRGAMMGTLACDHPDVEAFVTAKGTAGALRNFNLSVLVSDAFLHAVDDDADWSLAFPSRLHDEHGQVRQTIPARALWHRIAAAAHANAEPGVLFVDTINRDNNLYYRESISAANPCGEIPLPPHGCCVLGSINLTRFVAEPFAPGSRLDLDGIRETAAVAVRFLDNIIQVSKYPLDAQDRQARETRRIGLGVTGLADALVMLGARYSSADGRDIAATILETMRDSAYRASIELAGEKGAFPCLDKQQYLAGTFVSRLPEDLRRDIRADGIRNSHLLAIAPAGTISLLAGNVSSGIEPIYALEATRGIRNASGKLRQHTVSDYAFRLRHSLGTDDATGAPFETAVELSARDHLDMQAVLQPFVDNAISKTITLPEQATIEDVSAVLRQAHAAGIKGCTVYREGASVGRVLDRRPDTHCCSLDREPD